MTVIHENAFDVTALAEEMIEAARAALTGRGPALQAMGEMELRRLAGVLADIGGLLAKGDLDPERAKAMANIHQVTLRSVFRSIEGLGVIVTNQALEAVTGVAAAVVNRIVGFKLL